MSEDEDLLSRCLSDSLDLDSITSSPARAMYPASGEDPYLKLFRANPLDVLGENTIRQPNNIPEDEVGTPIQECFRGANVFITGGTGFVGKILTEKLVRSVPHLKHIYLLIRTKRGQSPEERFKLLLEDKVFSRMKAEVVDYANKVSAVEGDISTPGLGLSPADHQMLLDSVNFVFHSAADVRFIEPLRSAVASNVRGSRHVLDFAKEIVHLKGYVHVSTAYSQCVRREIEENVPKMNIHYKEVLKLVDSKTDTELQKELPLILQGWPNTYTFSKAVCEEMLCEEGQGLPLCIFKPSIVVNTYREPVRGWVDNMYGPIGLSVASGLGILHCLRCDSDLVLDMVPVDFVVNSIIAAAWNTSLKGPVKELDVYNFSHTGVKPMTSNELVKCGERFKSEIVFKQSIWCVSVFCTSSHLVEQVSDLMLHKLPGFFLDKVAVYLGQKPRLMKIYKSINTIKPYLDYFLDGIWLFNSDNVINLWNSMSEEDKMEFNFDMRTVDTTELFVLALIGTRYYYLKEPVEELPAALRKLRMFRWAHFTLKAATGLAVLKLLTVIAHNLPF